MIESRFARSIKTLQEQRGLAVESAILQDVLEGMDLGVRWVMNRYQMKEYPRIEIGNHSGGFADQNGYGRVSNTKEPVICYHLNDLKKLEQFKNSRDIYVTDHPGIDIPINIRPVVSVKQFFESFGVEETIHWLQDHNAKGLTQLPPRELIIQPRMSLSSIKYLLQPHEFEALQIKGIYFNEKYGSNPYQKLETYIADQKV